MLKLSRKHSYGNLEEFVKALPLGVRANLAPDSPTEVRLRTLQKVANALVEDRQDLIGTLEAIEIKAKEKMKVIQLRKQKCICSKKHLTEDLRRPNYKAAARLYGQAKEQAADQQDSLRLKAEMVKECVYKMVRNSLSRRDKENIGFYDSWGSDFGGELAEKLVRIKNISIDDIVHVFVEKEHWLKENGFALFDASKTIMDNRDLFMDLIVILGARKPIKPYLEKLIHDTDDARLLDLTSIWREKQPSYTQDIELKRERVSLFASAIKANEYCRTFFGEHHLHPEIAAINDLDILKKIVATTAPVDEEGFRRMVSAMAKINMMHLAETIRSQIDPGRMRVISQHLRKKLATYSRKKAPGSKLHVLHCCSGNSNDECEVAAISVPDEKSELAIARKFMDKDSDNTRNIEIEAIHDMIRFGVTLTKKDSKSPEKIEKATKKIIAIITAIFGTDISRGRLRYSFSSGITNENSTGKHEAFHFTIRYRYQCSSSGKNRWGTDKIKTIPVEVQIKKYMNQEEERQDHEKYARKKDKKIQRIMGMDMPFDEFLSDICDVLLSGYHMNDDVFRNDKICEFPVEEKLARILFRALTKRSADGTFVNTETLNALCGNPIAMDKIKKIIKKYIHYEAKHIGLLRLELKDKAVSGTEFTGWRRKIRTAIRRTARTGGIVRSSINEMALAAQKTIKSFEESQQTVTVRAP